MGLAPGGTQKMVDEMLSSTIFDAYWEPSMYYFPFYYELSYTSPCA